MYGRAFAHQLLAALPLPARWRGAVGADAPRRVLAVEHGRVSCPLQGDVPVDDCRRCRELLRVELQGGRPHVVCRPPRRRPLDGTGAVAAAEEGVIWAGEGSRTGPE